MNEDISYGIDNCQGWNHDETSHENAATLIVRDTLQERRGEGNGPH